MADPKSEGAFRTIGELSAEIGVPQHVLRYWESRFPQLRPLTRAGNRRYYRPEDVALVKRIRAALNDEGLTVRGVQKLLLGEPNKAPSSRLEQSSPPLMLDMIDELVRIRDSLRAALAD